MNRIFKLITLLAVSILVSTGVQAQSMVISCSQNDCYVVNSNDGELIVGTQEDKDIYILAIKLVLWLGCN